MELKRVDYEVYRYLEEVAKETPNKWVSKKELLAAIPILRTYKSTSHDECSALNMIRIRLNEATSEGKLSHLVLLDNNCFKIAVSKEEATKYIEIDKKRALKHLKRYWSNIGVIKYDNQGKMIDCRGNVITDESLAKRFNEVFNV